MRIPILAEQPRLHFADWRIAIVEITSELGTLYHPEHGWMAVGILTTEEQCVLCQRSKQTWKDWILMLEIHGCEG
jgi:hypothetical protein